MWHYTLGLYIIILGYCETMRCHGNFGKNVMSTFFQALDIAQPRKDKWINCPSQFSSFPLVELLFKCRFVAWWRGLIRMLCFVLINSIILNLLCVWSLKLLFLVFMSYLILCLISSIENLIIFCISLCIYHNEILYTLELGDFA